MRERERDHQMETNRPMAFIVTKRRGDTPMGRRLTGSVQSEKGQTGAKPMEKVKCSLSNVYCGQHVLKECIQLAWSLTAHKISKTTHLVLF